MSLLDVELEKEYLVQDIESEDEELKKFLFTLGCYKGEPVTVINKLRRNLILSIKDARYSIDLNLAKQIRV
ncbi:MAG: FeoA family protein [Erysipelotrichaceae bacterium]|nr:FeoA family protein [Erysipelotrichaceae bacterium]